MPGHSLLPCSPTRKSFYIQRLSLSTKHLPNAFSLPVLQCSTPMASPLSRHPVLHQLTSQFPHIKLHQEFTHDLRRNHRRKRFHGADVRQFHGKRERRNNISYRRYNPHLKSQTPVPPRSPAPRLVPKSFNSMTFPPFFPPCHPDTAQTMRHARPLDTNILFHSPVIPQFAPLAFYKTPSKCFQPSSSPMLHAYGISATTPSSSPSTNIPASPYSAPPNVHS